MNASLATSRFANAERYAPGVAVFAAIAGLALAGGGYGDTASGVMTVVVWMSLLVAAIAIPGERRRLSLNACAATLALGLISLLTLASMGFSPDPGFAFGEAVRVAGYAGVVLLVALRRREDAAAMLTGLAAAISLVALIAIGSRLLGLGAGDAALANSYPGSAGRLSYPVGYWNGLGALMAMGVPLLMWLGSGGRRSSLWVAALVPVLVTIYMTASRGAVLAALLGAALLAGMAVGRRRRSVAALGVGLIASAPALAAVQMGDGLLTEAFQEIGAAELTAAVILVLSISAAYVLAIPGGDLLQRVRLPRRAGPILGGAIALLAVVGLVVVGPGRALEEFTAISSADATSIGTDGGVVLSASGSGRAQFWDAALGAFASEPLRGIGAGGFESFWTREGGLEIVVRGAHSEPLELLAELGPFATLVFLGFFALVAVEGLRWRRASQPGPGEIDLVPAVGLAVLGGGLVGILIDWSWDLPVVALPVLILSSILLTGRAGAGPAGVGREPRSVSLPAPLAAAVSIFVALPIIWIGSVSAVGSAQLDESRSSYERGHLSESVVAARTAARLQPWAAEPWERVAIAERAADNDVAALQATLLALRNAPESFELWALAADLSDATGAEGRADAYRARGENLAPLVYSATFEGKPGSSAER